MTPSGGYFATAPYFATIPITSVSEHQIACRFDRQKMIDFSGSGLPPIGYDIGGVAGGEVVVLGREVGDDGAQHAREQDEEAAQEGADRVLVGGGGHGGLCG